MNLGKVSLSAIDAGDHARHRWYFFKEAFSPAVVDHVIDEASLQDGAVVVDPFSGSGTTPLAASLRGHRAFGIEVNPFLRFVGETKTAQMGSRKFLNRIDAAIEATRSRKPHWLEGFSTFSENSAKGIEQDKWLFNSSVLRAFGGSWEVTEKFGKIERSLVRLCLLGAALDVANAVKDGKCLRYRHEWRSMNFGRADFRNALVERANVVAEDLSRAPIGNVNPRIDLGDSRGKSFPEVFDVCVTSPPYLNSFDYTDVYRPELFLGGFVKDMDQLRKLRANTLRSHVQTKWSSPIGEDFGPHYSEAIAELRRRAKGMWDGRLPAMVQAYFEDMSLVLLRLRARAKMTSSVHLVVSTSAYVGVEIPVDLIIADIAKNCGWFLREVVVSRYLRRVSGQQWHELNSRPGTDGPHLRESVVVLDAQPRR